MNTPKPGIYHHFKESTKEYRFIGVAFHTETEESMVIYEPLYEGAIAPLFARPLDLFMGNVEKPEYAGPRFIWVRAS